MLNKNGNFVQLGPPQPPTPIKDPGERDDASRLCFACSPAPERAAMLCWSELLAAVQRAARAPRVSSPFKVLRSGR